MKKTIFGLLAFFILVLSSCIKNNNENNGGTWNFKGTNYNVMGCSASNGYGLNVIANSSVIAATSTTPDYELSVYFDHPLLPASNGSYTIIDTGNFVGNEVTIGLRMGYNSYTTLGGTYYSATGGNGTDQLAQVTILSSGKISISASNIVMRNDTNPNDSGILNFNIYQTSP